jgi:hypothetical protein
MGTESIKKNASGEQSAAGADNLPAIYEPIV